MLLSLKVFPTKGLAKSLSTFKYCYVTHIDLLKAHLAGYCFVVVGPDHLVGQVHEVI